MSVSIQHPGYPYLFDRLIDYCRKHWPEPLRYLNDAGLIFAPDSKPSSESGLASWATTHFALPFQCTLVEDYASCLLLYDLAPAASGFLTPRTFIDCISIDDRLGGVLSDADGAKAIREHLTKDHRMSVDSARTACRVNVGILSSIRYAEGQPVLFDGVLSDTFLLHPERGRISFGSEMPDQVVTDSDGAVQIVTGEDVKRERQIDALRNVIAGIEAVLRVNVPSRLVVERTERESRKGRPRRSRFSFVTPDEMHAKFRTSPSDGAPQHRQWRSFRPDAWPEDPIFTPAQWPSGAPTCKRIGKSDYRIRLDL